MAPQLLSLSSGNPSLCCCAGATHSARPMATSQGLQAGHSYPGPMEMTISKAGAFPHRQQEPTQVTLQGSQSAQGGDVCHMVQELTGHTKGAVKPGFLHKSPHSDGCGRPTLPNMSLQGQGQ